ncbi:RNA polymerase sigma factor [Leptolyngbya sp. GGD]|uniref:RNA polymerase sigma factor n=1 Tax=Leptolyngbya sp. GGD TaxID=2997907 RepID=UPI00227CAD6F|nr:sigma-70 family RNA polymerase sigma factor [Leptolyngbya sp. GGD]MCY6492028.1 sigma-70 family RNA polymerase sigma factor [Leptolyngbya sp. GGD]
MKAVAVPTFPEANHPIVKALFHHSDQELLTLFQRYPDSGQFFTALFCRYSPMVYALIQRSARSPVQAEYLLALIWRHVFHELAGVDLRVFSQSGSTFQTWLLAVTASGMNEAELPPVEEIHYDIRRVSPPFWCYLDRALEQLPALTRLTIVMAQTFHWGETRIAAYLQAEGEQIDADQVKAHLHAGYKALEKLLPDDIRTIYLGGNALDQESVSELEADFDPSLEEIEFF